MCHSCKQSELTFEKQINTTPEYIQLDLFQYHTRCNLNQLEKTIKKFELKREISKISTSALVGNTAHHL